MDDPTFDRLTKALAHRADRRKVVRTAAGATVTALAGFAGFAGRKSDKVNICHRTGNPNQPWVYITVAESALPAHLGHGDTANPGFLNDPRNCGGCGIVCGGDDRCRSVACVQGACVFEVVACDDGNPCTDSACDSATGRCLSVAVPGRPCDDAHRCVHNSICDENGICTGDALDCDDGIPCTIDLCDPAIGCTHTPDDALCDDGNECTVNVCDPSRGCVSTPVFDGAPCDNGNGACAEGLCQVMCEDPAFCAANADCCSGNCTCGTSLNTERFHCQGPFSQDFAIDNDGWNEIGSIEGSGAQFVALRVPSGTHGVASRNGAFHAEAGQHDLAHFGSATTRWGGFSNAFPSGGYRTSIDVYLDTAMNPVGGTDVRFDWSSGVNALTCRLRREFVFNVGTDPANPGRFALSASMAAGRASGNPWDPARDPLFVEATGWYTLRHDFRDSSGVLAVGLTVLDAAGQVLKTWTLSDPSDAIGTTVGGNRAGGFVSQEFPFLAFDRTLRI